MKNLERYSEFTYNELIEKAKIAKSRQHRFLIAESAEKIYPKQYHRDDFFLNQRISTLSYYELVKLFSYNYKRGSVKQVAMKRKEFNELDFPRK